MRFSSHNIEAYNTIRPSTLLNHLREHGWQKQGDFSERAEIWSYPSTNQDAHLYEVLLPTTDDIPDYASRIHDVFRMLEVVENRPTHEIFNDLVDVKAIATDKQREVLNVHLNFGDQSPHSTYSDIEASAKALGGILGSLQSLFDAIGQVKAGQSSAFGKISQEITTQTELSVLGTFQGSFGVRLAMPTLPATKQLELHPHSVHESQISTEKRTLGEKVVQEFVALLQDSREDKMEQLSDRLTSLQRRTVSNYQKFLQALDDADADLRIDWGAVNADLGGSACLARSNIPSLVKVIQTIESTAPQDYEIIGELLSASKTRQTFELLDRENEIPLSGTIPDEVMKILQSEKLALTIGQVYVFTVREKSSVSSVTGEVKVGRSLLKIRPWRLA